MAKKEKLKIAEELVVLIVLTGVSCFFAQAEKEVGLWVCISIKFI